MRGAPGAGSLEGDTGGGPGDPVASEWARCGSESHGSQARDKWHETRGKMLLLVAPSRWLALLAQTLAIAAEVFMNNVGSIQ